MANTTKKTTAPKAEKKNISTKETIIETPTVVDEPSVSVMDETAKENEALRKQMEDMKAQMELMAQMIAASKNAEPVKNTVAKDRNITFVNLTNGTAILKGNNIWKIEGRYATRTFLEREARIIVNNMPNMIRSGMVYIADAQFVEENDLADVYMNLLSDKELKELLSHDASYVIDAYKSVSEGQQKVIIDMIIDERLAGKKVDNNILVELGQLCGKDLINLEE